MRKAATIAGPYRYELTREWDGPGAQRPRVCWIMLNPSTADADVDDPTIRRCIGFSQAWGYGSLVVVNLFALRATNPKILYSHPDPVGPENDKFIDAACASSHQTICAWGNHGDLNARGYDVMKQRGGLWHLGLTKTGNPKHPLYLRAETPRVAWAAAPFPLPARKP